MTPRPELVGNKDPISTLMDTPVVNAWTQWGKLETVVVGRADPKSCHLPHEPACHAEINDPELERLIEWPGGLTKSAKSSEMASAQLANFCAVLEAETVQVKSQKAFDTELKREVQKMRTEVLQGISGDPAAKKPRLADDTRVHHKGKISVLRPTEMDWSKPVSGPTWSSPSQYCATCPRDTVITLGNTILEATMSKRSRYFENLACRDISLNLWRQQPDRVKFIAAPKPSMSESMYHKGFFDLTDDERWKRMRNYQFCCNEAEPVFDAADITRCGKDIFVQVSMTTNNSGIKWLTSHFPDLRVHPVHFPYDLFPSHIDCTFVPLRPPSKDGGDSGLALINSERPPLESEIKLWKANGWKMLNAPLPAQTDRPAFSQSSYWLSMNLLSISPNSVMMEENELPLYNLLSDYGFDPITIPMRHMYDYGGGIHCSTWDIKRQDSCVDYFPNQEYERSMKFLDSFNDIKVVDVSSNNDGYLLNPLDSKDGICGVGTAESKAKREGNVLTRHDTAELFGRTGNSGSFAVKGDHSEGWKGVQNNTKLSKDTLRIDNQPVMESWEKPYMQKLADLAAEGGGDLLEIGFGLGLSGRHVQTHKNVTSHTIIEANDAVFETLQTFAKEEAAAGRPTVVPVKGFWLDAVARLKDQGSKFDAILYDPYPQNESEQHMHQFLFMNAAKDLLKPGGRFVYCNLTSIGKLKESYKTWEELWTKSQLPYLTAKLCGFDASKCRYELFEFSESDKQSRGNCEYYMHDQALCPICIKS